jgi:hypothetical protein
MNKGHGGTLGASRGRSVMPMHPESNEDDGPLACLPPNEAWEPKAPERKSL